MVELLQIWFVILRHFRYVGMFFTNIVLKRLKLFVCKYCVVFFPISIWRIIVDLNCTLYNCFLISEYIYMYRYNYLNFVCMNIFCVVRSNIFWKRRVFTCILFLSFSFKLLLLKLFCSWLWTLLHMLILICNWLLCLFCLYLLKSYYIAYLNMYHADRISVINIFIICCCCCCFPSIIYLAYLFRIFIFGIYLDYQV